MTVEFKIVLKVWARIVILVARIVGNICQFMTQYCPDIRRGEMCPDDYLTKSLKGALIYLI